MATRVKRLSVEVGCPECNDECKRVKHERCLCEDCLIQFDSTYFEQYDDVIDNSKMCKTSIGASSNFMQIDETRQEKDTPTCVECPFLNPPGTGDRHKGMAFIA